jgi:hypothetical protein
MIGFHNYEYRAGKRFACITRYCAGVWGVSFFRNGLRLVKESNAYGELSYQKARSIAGRWIRGTLCFPRSSGISE